MMKSNILFESQEFGKVIDRFAGRILEDIVGNQPVYCLGVQSKGVLLMDAIVERWHTWRPELTVFTGELDHTFHRDDYRHTTSSIKPRSMHIPFDIDNQSLLLIDEVLHTGRTVRAALNTLFDYGRPSRVLLAVLINRTDNRQLPIQPDYFALQYQLHDYQSINVDFQSQTLSIITHE